MYRSHRVCPHINDISYTLDYDTNNIVPPGVMGEMYKLLAAQLPSINVPYIQQTVIDHFLNLISDVYTLNKKSILCDVVYVDYEGLSKRQRRYNTDRFDTACKQNKRYPVDPYIRPRRTKKQFGGIVFYPSFYETRGNDIKIDYNESEAKIDNFMQLIHMFNPGSSSDMPKCNLKVIVSIDQKAKNLITDIRASIYHEKTTGKGETVKKIYNSNIACIKALAAACAISRDHYNPKINTDDVNFAYNLIKRSNAYYRGFYRITEINQA